MNDSRYILRRAQKEAIAKALPLMRHGGGFGIWMEQRVGKTRTALEIVAQCRPTHLWIICPKAGGAAPEVWWHEVEKCTPLLPVLADLQITVQNYEWWTRKEYRNNRRRVYVEAQAIKDLFVICDEAHFIKTRGTTRSGVVRRIGKYAKWRLALTGTPIAQGLQDAWALYDFIDPSIFGRFDNVWEYDKATKRPVRLIEEGFDGRYLIWGGFKKRDIVGYNNEQEFYEKFHAHSYRVTLREAREQKLVVKYTTVPVTLASPARKAYEELKTELVTVINKTKIRVKNVLACLIKCQQVTGGSVLDRGDSQGQLPIVDFLDLGREKLDALCKVVSVLSSTIKFIVVARFIHEIERITAVLCELHFRVQQVYSGAKYDHKFDCDCLVMQIQSGVAVDMSQADVIIYYSLDYSLINFEQSRFRILNYTKPFVQYFFLIATDTVDEVIYAAIMQKKKVSQYVCDVYRYEQKAVDALLPTSNR
jgi:hypothetical protein